MGKKLKNFQEFPKMKNNFIENINNEKYFYSDCLLDSQANQADT